MEINSVNFLSDKSKQRIGELIRVFPQTKSIVLPVLHIVFDQFGYLDTNALKEAAELSGIPDIFFEEAANFYTMFASRPTGKYLIQVCHNICCTLLGADELIEYLKDKLEVEIGGTTTDGLFGLVTVECLGSCGTAPVMQINDVYYESLTQTKVDHILDELRKKT